MVTVKQKRILILGAGSLGIYIGTVLNSKDYEVTLLGRGKLKNIHDSILINNTLYKTPKRIYSLQKEEKFDIIFITSKLYDLEENLKNLAENKIKYKILVSIQNGLVDNTKYKEIVNNNHFVVISVFEGFRIIENQLLISKSKTGWRTEDTKMGKEISRILRSANIICTPDPKFEDTKAKKMIINCSINLLCAIEKKTCYELCKQKRTKDIMNSLFDETYNVLSNHYSLGEREPLRKLFYDTVSKMKHYTSTYQDAILGKKTEVDFLNSYIIKLAIKQNINVATNIKIVSVFKDLYP